MKGLAVLGMEKVKKGLAVLKGEGVTEEMVKWGMMIRCYHQMLHSSHFCIHDGRMWL